LENICKKLFECSHPRIFGSTRGFPKGLAANQQANYYRGEEWVFKGVISWDDNNGLVELEPTI
jgi:hypothetical protein